MSQSCIQVSKYDCSEVKLAFRGMWVSFVQVDDAVKGSGARGWERSSVRASEIAPSIRWVEETYSSCKSRIICLIFSFPIFLLLCIQWLIDSSFYSLTTTSFFPFHPARPPQAFHIPYPHPKQPSNILPPNVSIHVLPTLLRAAKRSLSLSASTPRQSCLVYSVIVPEVSTRSSILLRYTLF